MLRDNPRAVVGYRWRIVGHSGLIEIVSYRVSDPLAVPIRTEFVPADRGLGRDRSITILDEQIQTELPVRHRIQRYD